MSSCRKGRLHPKSLFVIWLWQLECIFGVSLAVQWLRLHASNAGGTVSFPGWGTKTPHVARCSQNQNKTNKKKNVFFS